MSLPGKLCVGILEEDNPLRAYFRFKPLLVDENGRYVPYDGAPDYPQDGCIRIVPDKNESYHFKARMRQIGLYCVVDLREHPDESDKIRPNKNYRPSGEEINASIIYSDVVRAPAEDMIFEVLPAETADSPLPAPRTRAALVRSAEGLNPLRHTWEAIPGSDGMGRLSPTEETCPVDALQLFELPGFRGHAVSFAIRPAGGMDRISDMPDRPAEAAKQPAPQRKTPAEPSREEAPARPVKAPEVSKAAQPAAPAEPSPPTPEAPSSAAPAEKPWIHHDESMLPPPVDRRLSRSEQLRAAQAGLNPRRGRSLQELIDEKWQHSRLNQLGQPVQPIATGAPVANPVDAAVTAVRDAWNQPQLRGPLMNALDALDDFNHTLETRREVRRQADIAVELEALEAQKLSLLGELDHLKANTDEVRRRLADELRRQEQGALAEAIQKTEAARAEQARYEQLAADARAAARDAQAIVDELSGDQLERKIRDVALTRRVLERLDHLKPSPAAAVPPADAARIDLDAFIERVERRFAAEGWRLSRLETANLCVSLALGPVLYLTGAPGSGKTTAARLLADALGIPAADRAAPRPHGHHGRRCPKGTGSSPAIILLDDANLAPGPDPLRGIAANLSPECRVVATLQDAHSGNPVCAAAWDAGFAVRLTPPDTLPWQPAKRARTEAESPASIAGILESLPQAAVPAALIERMDALRRALASGGATLSRRALDDAWRYAAAMLAVLGDAADGDAIFDLAVAQRLLPCLLASAPIETAVRLEALVQSMPACAALLRQPLPVLL